MRSAGLAIFSVAGAVLFAFELFWFFQWWGGIGVLAGVMFAPLAAVFPFVYLALEGFSALYFGTWLVGVVGIAMTLEDG